MKILTIIAASACTAAFCGTPTGKIVEKILFPANAEWYRYSEGTVLNLDEKKELLLAVNVYSKMGGDRAPSQIVGWRSHDGGLTWDDKDRFVLQSNIGKDNVGCPSFLRLSKKEVLLFFMVGNSTKDAGPWVRRSLDNAKTWGEPVKLPYEGYGAPTPNEALRLKTERILLPCFGSRDVMETVYAYNFYSDDKGHTWKRSSEVTVPVQVVEKRKKRATAYGGNVTRSAAEEPTVAELKDGRLLMLMRTYNGSFYKSYSKDHGETWSEPVNSGIPAPASMPILARIPTTGDLMLLYNYAKPEQIKGGVPRNRMAAAISKNEGETFISNIRILDGNSEFDGKITMPTIAFVGKNAVVFYSKVKMSEIPKGGSSNYFSWMQQVMPIRWFYEEEPSKNLE